MFLMHVNRERYTKMKNIKHRNLDLKYYYVSLGFFLMLISQIVFIIYMMAAGVF